MTEHQTIEWKSSWDDEYLKWICGYANAYGGTLFIGKEDSGGKVVGITNARELLKVIPDKITHTMGIIADVNLKNEGDREYLEIVVDKYPSLISLRGKYYYRSGSTMRTITGVELEKMLLKSHGRSWDSVPLTRVTIEDLEQSAVELFKEKAVASDRLTSEEVNVETRILMENLHLFDETSLIRAAVMAFHKDIEKWFFGSYIKVGYFVTDSDLRYMDEIHGPLIKQVDKVIDLIYTKYMKALIFYEGTQRFEKYMFPREAFKEILTNAVVHKDYSSNDPIQISVYEDKIYIYNSGTMPPELSSPDKLFKKHSSRPHNPKLAHVFFKSGMIEAWGRGFDTIKKECEKHNTALPEYNIMSDGVMVLCKSNEKYIELLNSGSIVQNDRRIAIQKNQTVSEYERIASECLTEAEKIGMADILEYLRKHDVIDNKKGRDLTGKSASTVRRYLVRMCGVGLLVPSGTTRDVVYRKMSEND